MNQSLGQALITYFVDPILFLFYIVIILGIILSWLVNFNVVNTSNQLVSMIWRLTHSLTEPVLRPIRRVLPPIGGMDFSPLVLLLALMFIRGWLLPRIYVAL
ncbi:YggT family protein [Maricaulis sp.]|uniref:YggT family protein n=1 Tax=Maricaulis sp. TaxID=1486257 RepID=UPI0025B97D4C|nr:YggT family protein [Maricaulis sp.]